MTVQSFSPHGISHLKVSWQMFCHKNVLLPEVHVHLYLLKKQDQNKLKTGTCGTSDHQGSL